MESLAAIILSGGFSSRMGTDKGLVLFKGKPLIERTLTLARNFTETILIIANTDGYEQFGYPVYKDIMKEKGPLGGIHAGLTHSNSNRNLVLACDMPLLNHELITHVLETDSGELVAVPRHDGQIEPLCAVYRKACLDQIEMRIHSSDLSLHGMIKSTSVKYLDMDENLPFYSPYLFSNVNTVEELANLKN